MKKYISDQSKIINFKHDLKDINLKLWNIEDAKDLQKKLKFDEEFIELARKVISITTMSEN